MITQAIMAIGRVPMTGIVIMSTRDIEGITIRIAVIGDPGITGMTMPEYIYECMAMESITEMGIT